MGGSFDEIFAHSFRTETPSKRADTSKADNGDDALAENLLEGGCRRFSADVVACITCQDSGAGLPWNGELLARDGEWWTGAGVTDAA